MDMLSPPSLRWTFQLPDGSSLAVGILIFFFGIALPFRDSSAIIKRQNAPIVMGGRFSVHRFRLIHGGGFLFLLNEGLASLIAETAAEDHNQIHSPADAEQTAGEQPNNAAASLADIEAVSA